MPMRRAAKGAPPIAFEQRHSDLAGLRPTGLIVGQHPS